MSAHLSAFGTQKFKTKFYSLDKDGCIKNDWLGKTFLYKENFIYFTVCYKLNRIELNCQYDMLYATVDR